MDNQKDYEALEEKQTYTILDCLETNDPQNIFVRSPSLNREVTLIYKILMMVFAIVIIECVIVFGGWGICRLTPDRGICYDDMNTLSYFIFFFTVNAGTFACVLGATLIILVFMSMMDRCRDRIVNINAELKNDDNNPTGAEVDV
uniref:Uncharacterized protein n=1 Tax=viral metagenome TaxID=1070528 RepID=A0A6C0C9D3_9ZZZZ